MWYVDPSTGASFFVTLDGQVSAFAQTPQYYIPQNLETQQCTLPLAQHSTSTFGVQQAVNNQGYKATIAAQSEVDDLVDLVGILYQQEDPATTSQDQVAELATSLKNSLPSTPTSSEEVDSPIMMHRMETLPGISTLSAEISSLQAQLLGPLSPPVKKQYPFYPSPAPSRVSAPQVPSTLPSLPLLPVLNHPNPAQQARKPTRVPEPSPESSPCSSPPQSPKRNKKNYTKEFNIRFHELLNSNEQASNEWHLYAGRHKGKCTIKRAPCIKVSRGFCASYGHEFTDLAKEEKYGALGTRTECACMHKPQPLSSSGPSRKQRQSARSAPYPSQSSNSPNTPQDLELPSTPTERLSKQAWISFLLQNAPVLHEGFNTFMGGLQCSACTASRAFASRDEVIAYLMREPIACAQECCAGQMQLHQ